MRLIPHRYAAFIRKGGTEIAEFPNDQSQSTMNLLRSDVVSGCTKRCVLKSERVPGGRISSKIRSFSPSIEYACRTRLARSHASMGTIVSTH